MILAELLSSFREASGDLAEPYLWSDDNLIILLNEAESEAALRKSLLFDDSSAITQISVVAGTARYALDPSIISVNRAILISGSDQFILDIIDRERMDSISVDWRNSTTRPTGLIVDDTSCELNSAVDADYILALSVYRLPVNPVSLTNITPEIAPVHHRFLVDWMLYRAFSKIDADAGNKNAASSALYRFESYFGIRTQANTRKRVTVPQTTKIWW